LVLRVCGSFDAAVGDEVNGCGLSHTFVFVIDDDGGVGALAVEANLDFFVFEQYRRLVGGPAEGEGVRAQDGAGFLDVEDLVICVYVGQIPDAGAVECEAVYRLHAERGVYFVVVFVLHPGVEGAVESAEGGEVEGAGKEVHAHGAEETLDFSFRGAVAHRRVQEEASHAGADEGDLLG